MNVIFTLKKIDGTTIDIKYKPFSYTHSKLWVKGIEEFLDKGIPLIDTDRLFNFNPLNISINQEINQCNLLIDKINFQLNQNLIPHIRSNYLQEDINFVHSNFVDSDKEIDYTKNVNKKDWSDFNDKLHGLEINLRHYNKEKSKPQGQVFVELYGSRWDLPESSYKHFTVRNTFGYCYANYVHVGRHITELFNANDLNIKNDQIVPMSKISGSSRLWFGNTTPKRIVNYKLKVMKKWYEKNKINEKIGIKWGDQHLAIGWLPVARMTNSLTKKDLYDVIKLIDVSIK